MSDPGLDLAKAATEGAASGLMGPVVDAGRAMVAAVFGDTAGALDDYMAGRIRERTLLRQLETFARAKKMCEEAGVEPQQIGLSLFAGIAGGSIEEDESLSEKWAALLANASTEYAGSAPVLQAFPRVLAELDPADAALLDRIAATEDAAISLIDLQLEFHPESRDDQGEMSRVAAFDLHIANLERLGLCVLPQTDPDLNELKAGLERQRVESWPTDGGSPGHNPLYVPIEREPSIRLTEWGQAFLAACTPPQAAA